MSKPFLNEVFLKRLDELILEGERQWSAQSTHEKHKIMDIVGFTQWATSSLNLLDKLSVSTNRFVKQFEVQVCGGPGQLMNSGAALGVLKSARDEYACGLAVEYHLSVSAIVFGGLLDEAAYLLSKGYTRAAAVLLGAALEEGLKARARASSVDVGPRDTLSPVIVKLKAPEVRVLTEFEAKRLEAIAKLRNDAAHGGDFSYSNDDVGTAIKEVQGVLNKLLGGSG